MAILVVALCLLAVLIWIKNFRMIWSWKMIVFALSTLLVSGSWFLIEWMNGHSEVINEFIQYQIRLLKTEDSGHSGPVLYHVFVLLIGCFPTSLLFLLAYRARENSSTDQDLYRKLMLALFWVVLILFSIVKTKIIHYSSLCYFPLSFIAANGIANHSEKLRFKPLLTSLYVLLSTVIGNGICDSWIYRTTERKIHTK